MGRACTAPCVRQWQAGTNHTIAAANSQEGPALSTRLAVGATAVPRRTRIVLTDSFDIRVLLSCRF